MDLTLPASLMSGPSNLTVVFGSSDGGYANRNRIDESLPFDPTLPLITDLKNGGRLFVWLGGTVLPTSVQPSGAYNATIVLTVAYTGN